MLLAVVRYEDFIDEESNVDFLPIFTSSVFNRDASLIDR
jgi:hypothetical protein